MFHCVIDVEIARILTGSMRTPASKAAPS